MVFDQECALLRQAGHEVVTYLRDNNDVDGYKGMERLALIPRTNSGPRLAKGIRGDRISREAGTSSTYTILSL